MLLKLVLLCPGIFQFFDYLVLLSFGLFELLF